MPNTGEKRLYKNINCAECERPAEKRGFCTLHYQRARRAGTLQCLPRLDATTRYLKNLLLEINKRCNNPKNKAYRSYGGKGIKNYLTLDDLRFLYERDQAHLLIQRSIDRKDSDKDYTLDNCRFIEFDENRRHRKARCICRKCGILGRFHKNYICANCRASNYCKICKKPFNGGGLFICAGCRRIERPCGYCGAPVVRDRVLNKDTIGFKHWFCSQSEFAKWVNRNRGVAKKAKALQAA